MKGLRGFMSDVEAWRMVPPDLVKLILKIDQIESQPNSLRSIVYQNLDHNRSIPALTPLLEEIDYIKTKLYPEAYLNPETRVINFERCAEISAVVEGTFLKVKRNPYPFADIPIIQKWLKSTFRPLDSPRAKAVTDVDYQQLVEYITQLEAVVESLPPHLRPHLERPEILSLHASALDDSHSMSLSSPRKTPTDSPSSTPRASNGSDPVPRTFSRGLPRTPTQVKRHRNSSDLRSAVRPPRKRRSNEADSDSTNNEARDESLSSTLATTSEAASPVTSFLSSVDHHHM